MIFKDLSKHKDIACSLHYTVQQHANLSGLTLSIEGSRTLVLFEVAHPLGLFVRVFNVKRWGRIEVKQSHQTAKKLVI